MRKDILFTTWHSSDRLYQMMSSFIDRNVIPVDTSPALQYFFTVLNFDWGNIKWLIHIDEDVFIYDLKKVYELIKHMEKNGYDVAGIPDGGVIKIRDGNPLSINPFFSIYNYKKIRKIITDNPNFDLKCDDLMKYLPSHLFKKDIGYDSNKTSESYYSLYFKLLRNDCKFLWLDGETSKDDNISTYLLNHKNEAFLIHSWFARRYNETNKGGMKYPRDNPIAATSIEFNSERINSIFNTHITREVGLKTYQKQK